MSQINSPNQASGSVPVSRQNSNNALNTPRRSNRLTSQEIDNVAKLSLTIDEKLIQSFSQSYCSYFNKLIEKPTELSSLDSLEFIQLQLLEHLNQFKVAASSYQKELEIMEIDETELEREIEEVKLDISKLETELKVEEEEFQKRRSYDSLVGEISSFWETDRVEQAVSKLQDDINGMNDKISIKQENFNYLKDFFQQIELLIRAAKDGITKMQKDGLYKLQESEALSPMISNTEFQGSNAPNSPQVSNSEANAPEDTTSPVPSTNEVSTPQSSISKKHTRDDEFQIDDASKRPKAEGTDGDKDSSQKEEISKSDINNDNIIEKPTSEALNMTNEGQSTSNTNEVPVDELED